MAKYRFPNFEVVIDNPQVIINPVVRNVNPVAMTICVDITLSVEGVSFGVTLEDVAVQNLHYDSDSLQTRVMEKLSQLEVTE